MRGRGGHGLYQPFAKKRTAAVQPLTVNVDGVPLWMTIPCCGVRLEACWRADTLRDIAFLSGLVAKMLTYQLR